jgi:hypothetical protein
VFFVERRKLGLWCTKNWKGFGRNVVIFFKIIFNIYLEGMKNPSKLNLFRDRDLCLDYVTVTQRRRSL